MSIADVYESGEQKQNKSHLENLIAIALVDGILEDSEKELLQKFANRMSIDQNTFNEMLKGIDKYAINPPVDIEDRYQRLYNLIKISLVDDSIDSKEANLLHRYAIGLGYEESKGDELINKTIKFITDGLDFDAAFDKI